MNRIYATLFIVFSISLCAVTSASVEEGIAAFHAGDYPKAVELLEPHPDDALAQRYLALVYDKNYHVLWDFAAFEGGAPIYSAGVEFDEDRMHEYYTRVIEMGDIIGRWYYCEWTRSMLAGHRTHIKNSRCKNKQVWRVMRAYAQDHVDDPVISYYHWIIRSGELGTGDRRARARELLLPKAMAGDALYQFYLGRVYFGFNARRDRAPDLANAYLWFSAASMGGNYRAKAIRQFLRKQLDGAGQLDCVETYAVAMLNNLIAAQNAEPAPNDVSEATQSCNEHVFEVGL